MPEPLVRFRGVNKSFGRAQVLRGIDFDVPAGECMGLAGLNGAGKTTLIKCLLDFCDLDSGAIEVHGIEHRRPRARARLAFLPERFTAPYFLTGREFMAMMLQLFGGRYEEARVRAMFAALDLEAAALEQPMSGLDARARVRAKDLLLKLKSDGRTVFLVSHSLADIEEVCDQMIVLHLGTLAYVGAPHGLCERYGEPSLERAFLKCIEAHA